MRLRTDWVLLVVDLTYLALVIFCALELIMVHEQSGKSPVLLLVLLSYFVYVSSYMRLSNPSPKEVDKSVSAKLCLPYVWLENQSEIIWRKLTGYEEMETRTSWLGGQVFHLPLLTVHLCTGSFLLLTSWCSIQEILVNVAAVFVIFYTSGIFSFIFGEMVYRVSEFLMECFINRK